MSMTYPPLLGRSARCCICNTRSQLYWGVDCIQCTSGGRCDELLFAWGCGQPCNGNCSRIRGQSHVCSVCGESDPVKIRRRMRDSSILICLACEDKERVDRTK